MNKSVTFQIVMKQGPRIIFTLGGVHGAIDTDRLTAEDVQEIPKVEAFLEKLTGVRFHIEQLHEGE